MTEMSDLCYLRKPRVCRNNPGITSLVIPENILSNTTREFIFGTDFDKILYLFATQALPHKAANRKNTSK